jgi:hypothetical protein
MVRSPSSLAASLVAMATFSLLAAVPALADGSDPPVDPAETLLAQSSQARSMRFQADCPECDPPKKFLPAFGELMAVQFIPWSINHFARDAEWADISPGTWWTNMSNPWLWDNNQFLNNQFSHPYHGSLYFNAGRANGYNFWESMVWAGGGSLMWELYGEAWAPSPNDWFNTTLGGISLGEMLWRVSSLSLDNTSTGSERTWREIGAAALNPVRGFSRLVNGQTHGVRPNPEEWRPSKSQATFDIGNRRTSGFNQSENLDQLYGELLLSYGDQVEDLSDKPFSACFVTLEIAPNQPKAGSLSQLRARGSLGAHTLSRGKNQVHKLAGFMTYEYFNSPAFQFGGQGFHGGLVSRWGPARGKRTQLEVLGSFLPISALRSDHYVTLEGRDYDYGPSFGGWLRLARLWEGRGLIQATGRTLYTPIVSGFDGDHIQATATAEGRFYLNGRIGAGASWSYYYRHSLYDDFSDVRQDGRQVRAFVAYAFPRWQP